MINKFYSVKPILDSNLKQVYIETYGCQMNVSDSEVVLSVLQSNNYSLCSNLEDASIVFINTCSIRDNAEQKIWSRLDYFRSLKKKNKNLKVGVLGCMAERLKEKLLEDGVVDIVAGPDSYRDLPLLLTGIANGEKQINTILSEEETYADISPVRMDKNGVSAFISIMRGCNNYCSYCVVPYVRGRERSRNPQSIINEAKQLLQNGYREVTLLGQNVNSYHWENNSNLLPNQLSQLKSNKLSQATATQPSKPAIEQPVTFAQLLVMVAQIDPSLRVRFSTSHPKDIDESLIRAIAKYPNICKHVHLPIQSGSNAVLKRMGRKYTREGYLKKANLIKELIPECSLSTDIIAGFSGETEQDHQETLSAIREVGYYTAFMFQYSERPDTLAAKKYPDNVLTDVKNRRLSEIIALQQEFSHTSNKADLGKTFEVLVEGASKRSSKELFGRTSQNKVCIFPAGKHKVGDYVNVKVVSCSSATLKGVVIG